MIPVARTQHLSIQQLGEEVLVYDEINNISHHLYPITATVWHYCDGQHSVKEIAHLLEKELPKMRRETINMRGLVWLTLEELERYKLIKEYIDQPIHPLMIAHRTVMEGMVLTPMFSITQSLNIS